jgi:hypothetical protein
LKKVLTTLFLLVLATLLTGGYLILERYQKNTLQLFPYPYEFQNSAVAFTPDAPILIAGDRMAEYFAKFRAELADVISKDLAKPIKIQSVAKSGHGLHRTLHELHSLTQWPQIVIYQGGSEEFNEIKFDPTQTPLIKKNFKLYADDRVETAIMLFHWVSRIIYEPMNKMKLSEAPTLLAEIQEQDYLRRLDTEILLFEQQLIQLVNLSKDRNSLLILTTTPINLDIEPKRVCTITMTPELEKEIDDLKILVARDDFKAAYTKAGKLIQQNAGNALIFYLHGQSAKRLGQLEEARNSLLQASAFDCDPWRATEVQNTIIRRVAKAHQVMLFDLARFIEADWGNNTTFFDELFAQNLYYERGVNQLGLAIKEILKL